MSDTHNLANSIWPNGIKIDADGNFYNILGAQFIYVDDPETYGMFTCEDDAAVNMRLTKIVK